MRKEFVFEFDGLRLSHETPTSTKFMKEDDGRSKKLTRLLVVGFLLEFLSHCENGVSIDRTLVVTEDHFALAAVIHSALPAVLPQIIGNAVGGIGLCKEIDAAIVIAIYPVGQDIGG